MQTYCLEYTVLKQFSPSVGPGLYPAAPPFTPVGSGKPDEKKPDPDGIYRFTVDRLGFVVPQVPIFGPQVQAGASPIDIGVNGDRFITAIDWYAPGSQYVILFGFALPLGAGDYPPVNTGAFLVFSERFSSQGCIFVPQGSQFVISSQLPLTSPGFLRLKISQPESPEEYAKMLAACCCGELVACPSPIIDSVSPSSIECDGSPVTVTLRGSGLSGLFLLSVTTACGATLTPSSVVTTDSQITFSLSCSALGQESCYLDIKLCYLRAGSGAFDCCIELNNAIVLSAD